MSEKASLLTSIPPVKTETAKASSSRLLSPTPVKSKTSEEGGALLSQIRDLKPARKPEVVKLASVQTTDVNAVETVASEAVADEASSITVFQVITYASFVLNFLLAGAAAVILFKKAAKLTEERFVVSVKTLAIASVLIMLYGFFATYLYAAYLNASISSAPLVVTMGVWVLIGPAVGFITRNLLARKDKPNRRAAYVDAGIYGAIFFLAACGVSSAIKTNAALLLSTLAGFLMIVPIARSFAAFRLAKARHKELNEMSDQILIYALLLMPALIPILAFAYVCGLSDAITLFLINFITFDFVIVVVLAMIVSADELIPEEAVQTVVETEGPSPEPVVVDVTAQESVADPEPKQVFAGNPDDPIIQFLNSEAGVAPEQPVSQSTASPAPRILPPRKPGARPGIVPPAKPGSAPTGEVPNTPSRLKTPAKPKKRF